MFEVIKHLLLSVRVANMKPFAIALQLIISTVVLAKKNLIIDTDLFSDVE